MGVLTGFKNAARKFHDTWVSPQDEPRREQPGVVHIVTPGGKIEVTAMIGSGTDARDMRKVIDILLTKCAEDEDFETFIGRAD